MNSAEIDKERAHRAFLALERILNLETEEDVDLLVCGGMALIITGEVRRRRTRDIDCIGFVEKERSGELAIRMAQESDFFIEAKRRVAALFSLPDEWLNFDAGALAPFSPPEGILERAEVIRLGERLTVRVCSRRDMVTLKMLGAASGEGREKDLDDLTEMQISESEARQALDFCLARDIDRQRLAVVLESLGYEGLL